MCCFGGTGSARLNQSLFTRYIFLSLLSFFSFFALFLIWRIVFCINRCLLLFSFSNRPNVWVLIFAFPPLIVRHFGFSLPSFHAVGQAQYWLSWGRLRQSTSLAFISIRAWRYGCCWMDGWRWVLQITKGLLRVLPVLSLLHVVYDARYFPDSMSFFGSTLELYKGGRWDRPSQIPKVTKPCRSYRWKWKTLSITGLDAGSEIRTWLVGILQMYRTYHQSIELQAERARGTYLP